MSRYDTYCLEPDYTKGYEGWANSETNDQWLSKSRGGNISVTVNGVKTSLFSAGLHPNRDEPHGVWFGFIPSGTDFTVSNNRGSSTYWQCIEL